MQVDAAEPGIATGISTPSHGEPRSGAAPAPMSEFDGRGSLEIDAGRERPLHAEGQRSANAKNPNPCARRLMRPA